MISKYIKLSFLFFTCLFYGCIDSFEPPILQAENNFLVVEGALISGGGLTTIKLSRTANISDTSYIQPVVTAKVMVVGENGSNQNLSAQGNGEYVAELILNPEESYYLSIITAEDKRYQSEAIRTLSTPAIDSLNWQVVDNNVKIYVNTHDFENNNQFYKWDFVETYEFNAAYYSYLEYVDGEFIIRSQENQIYTCWQTDNATSILLGSTAALSENIIYQKPITSVPFGVKLSEKYSILVSQYSLSKEAYFYFENMKKNSEELGSFYDAQPTEITGNIYAVDNPEEPVIGYVYASNIAQKRIFIGNKELDYLYKDTACPEDVVVLLEPGSEEELFVRGSNIPIMFNEFGQVLYTNSYCGSCKVRGSTIRPPFWE